MRCHSDVLESFRDISSARNRYLAETTENLQNIVIYQPNIHLHSRCYFYWQKIYCMIKDTTNLQLRSLLKLQYHEHVFNLDQKLQNHKMCLHKSIIAYSAYASEPGMGLVFRRHCSEYLIILLGHYKNTCKVPISINSTTFTVSCFSWVTLC